MSYLRITEYKDMVIYPDGAIQAPQEPPLAVQIIDFTASVASAVFQEDTKFVSIQLSANGYIQFGAAPTAVNTAGAESSRTHEANAVSFHGVDGSLKIAAIDAA